MTNREVIIPEIVTNDIRKTKDRDFNINLTQNNHYNKRNYSKNDYSNIDNSTNTTTTNINNKHGLIVSFILFLFNIVALPFRLIIKIYNYIENKKPKHLQKKHSKFYKKWLKNKDDLYYTDEIY